MGRKNEPKSRMQKSKRARLHHKQAEWAFGKRGRWVAHPSHIAYRKNRAYRRIRKDWDWMMGKSIKAISVWQPWASLIATGVKQYETRSWATSWRGYLAIQASKRWSHEEYATTRYLKNKFRVLPEWPDVPLPLEVVIGIARLVDVVPTVKVLPKLSSAEAAFGNFAPGRYAWKLEMVELFDEPRPAKGKQGLWWWTWDGGR